MTAHYDDSVQVPLTLTDLSYVLAGSMRRVVVRLPVGITDDGKTVYEPRSVYVTLQHGGGSR